MKAEPKSSTELRFPRVMVRVGESALVANYRALSRLVPGQLVLPMIKADAYGHGALWAARVLWDLPGLYALGVATLEEGAEIRAALGERGRGLRIVCFSGAAPWNEDKVRYCLRHALTPVIGNREDWRRFSRSRAGGLGRLPYELKFNTGMNRLGIPLEEASKISRRLHRITRGGRRFAGVNDPVIPSGIMTHLACAEDPGHPVSRQQLQGFRELRELFSGHGPSTRFHLANSAGIWNREEFRLAELTDVVRPGLSLYGIPPWEGAETAGLRPVMRVQARVVARRELLPGETVGYGATFVAPAGRCTELAILSAGYADGVPRSLSNRGVAIFSRGEKGQFAGTVSMDLSAIRCPRPVRLGEWVDLFGGRVNPWEQARAAGTIPYELLTSWSARVQRAYE